MSNDDILNQWLGDPGAAVTLPSGKPYRLRHVDVLALADAQGGLPNLLRGMVDVQRGDSSVEEESALSEQLLAAQPFLNRLARACIVSPPIVADPGQAEAGHGVLVHRVPLVDKMALVVWALGGAAALEQTVSFPSGAGLALAGVDAPTASERVGPATE